MMKKLKKNNQQKNKTIKKVIKNNKKVKIKTSISRKRIKQKNKL